MPFLYNTFEEKKNWMQTVECFWTFVLFTIYRMTFNNVHSFKHIFAFSNLIKKLRIDMHFYKYLAS